MSLNPHPKCESTRRASHKVGFCRPVSVLFALITTAWLLGTSGCIALSIPSERYHDPHDRGGLLGDFRRGSLSRTQHLSGDESFQGGFDNSSDCTSVGCSALHGSRLQDSDLIDDEEFSLHKPKTVEVPWPRYHPVPTRPVFSGYPGGQP